MAHRRKSSHPVCKTRRNHGTSWDLQTDAQENDDDNDVVPSSSTRSQALSDVTMETEGDSGQQIMIPPDLYKDFEAMRSKTKLDTTDLMRRLLRDCQSLATTSDKAQLSTVNMSHPDDQTDIDLHQGAVSMATNASIATDVSLATTCVDTDEDEFQGLDLTVSSRKISSRLFDTKSMQSSSGTFDQPLDLTCSKSANEHPDSESPTSSQMEMTSVNNEFNYVYVYPGLYPPNASVLPGDDIESESPKRVPTPVPELISPGQISIPQSVPRQQYGPPADVMDAGFGLLNPNTYNAYVNSAMKGHTVPSKKVSQKSNKLAVNVKQEPLEIGEKVSHSSMRISPSQSPCKPNKVKEAKKQPGIKIISENTSYPGIYTSIMKLPWSRRTRTKKPKHKVKLEDTLVPQFMLDQSQAVDTPEQEAMLSQTSPQTPSNIPDTTQSVMMVYPNSAMSAYGKPVRKRGRPPKLPMLAKLLQHEQASKKMKKEKTDTDKMQAQITQQVQANGGMLVYNSGGQIMTAVGGMPVQQSPGTPMPGQQPHQFPSNMVPDMSQAQLIGQFPLSQVTSGQIQFLGQFPANAIPFPGQQVQAIQVPVPDGQIPQQLIPQSQSQVQITNVADNENQDNIQNDSSPKQDPAVPIQYQYAFQPMLVPTQVPAQIPIQPLDTTTESPDDTDGCNHPETTSVVTSPNQIDGLSTENMSGGPTHVMKHEASNTISTMSTTSIANTGTGAIYQEMILSSKSLVDVKKRKRQTAIQLLKSKSSDQNFLCTSFRIRPRLVAQAQAQRERMAAKGVNDIGNMEDIDIDQKNLISPQNDKNGHFGETNESCDVDLAKIQIKREVDDDELYENLGEYGIVSSQIQVKLEAESDTNDNSVVQKPNSAKRFMLKGSQKRKAKSYRSMFVNDSATSAPMDSELGPSAMDDLSNDTVGHEEGSGDSNSMSTNMFQELFNCKICNKIIPVNQMEAHSVEHLRKKIAFHCNTCGMDFEENAENTNGELPKCETCNEALVKIDVEALTRKYGHGKIACDECPETFKSLPEFYEHKTEVHKDENTIQGEFECDFCGKVYQYYHALQFHRRTHRERKVPCLDKTCDAKFRSRKEMETHFDAKHPDKKEYYHCVYDGCSKKFLKNFHLQEHIRVKHYNIKAFQCPWPGCIKEFAAQRHLKIHLLIHRDEKPMKCDHCDYRCRQRSAMNWHMRKHPDVPYKYKRAVKSPSMSAAESE